MRNPGFSSSRVILAGLVVLQSRIDSQSIIQELTSAHAVLTNACISHFDGTVLVWPTSEETTLAPGRVTAVNILYHPLRDGLPGHNDYHPKHERRSVLLRSSPRMVASPLPPGPTADGRVSWVQDVSGAAIFGTFTMGSGKFSSLWHGFLEPLVDVWEHIRRRAHYYSTPAALWQCPRYHVFLTDEVLGKRREWIRSGYLTAFWRAFVAKAPVVSHMTDDDDRVSRGSENDPDDDTDGLRFQSILDVVTSPGGHIFHSN